MLVVKTGMDGQFSSQTIFLMFGQQERFLVNSIKKGMKFLILQLCSNTIQMDIEYTLIK